MLKSFLPHIGFCKICKCSLRNKSWILCHNHDSTKSQFQCQNIPCLSLWAEAPLWTKLGLWPWHCHQIFSIWYAWIMKMQKWLKQYGILTIIMFIIRPCPLNFISETLLLFADVWILSKNRQNSTKQLKKIVRLDCHLWLLDFQKLGHDKGVFFCYHGQLD